jgi:hypothetical protein
LPGVTCSTLLLKTAYRGCPCHLPLSMCASPAATDAGGGVLDAMQLAPFSGGSTRLDCGNAHCPLIIHGGSSLMSM